MSIECNSDHELLESRAMLYCQAERREFGFNVRDLLPAPLSTKRLALTQSAICQLLKQLTDSEVHNMSKICIAKFLLKNHPQRKMLQADDFKQVI